MMQNTSASVTDATLLLRWEGGAKVQKAWLGHICLEVRREGRGTAVSLFSPIILIDRIFLHGETMDEMKLVMEIALAGYIALEGGGRR